MKLVCRNLSVGYEGRSVIDGIDTEIPEGKITALIGPNGAGKSTILKTVIGQIPPVKGEVLLDGRGLRSVSAGSLARKLAVVLTKQPKLRMMTGYELIAQGRYPYTGLLGLLRDEDKETIERVIKTVGAEELAKRQFEELSDGEKQKLLIARALCQEPMILVLDEPFLFLDIGRQLELFSILKKVAEEGKTVLLSIHDLGLSARLADRLLCVGKGKIFYDGTPEEILTEEKIRELYGITGKEFDPYLKGVKYV